MNDVTRILCSVEQGDDQAAEQLLPLVYDGLRKLAAQRLAQVKPGQTLQATALVHEAYLRLVGSGEPGSFRQLLRYYATVRLSMGVRAEGSIIDLLRPTGRTTGRYPWDLPFSCGESPRVHRVYDCARSGDGSHIMPPRCCLPRRLTASAPRRT
jgi:hypothetical protein